METFAIMTISGLFVNKRHSGNVKYNLAYFIYSATPNGELAASKPQRKKGHTCGIEIEILQWIKLNTNFP